MDAEFFRGQLRRAVESLALPASRFRLLPDDAAREVCRRVEVRFVAEPHGHWWWAHLRDPSDSIQYRGGTSGGYWYLDQVVPPGSGVCWLIVAESPSFLVAEARIEDIQAVIGECSYFEYFVVSRHLDWLLCENHHDYLIAVGDEVRGRLHDLAARHGSVFGLGDS